MANSSPALVLLLALASPRLASAGNVPGVAGSEGSGRGFQGQYTHQYAEQFEEYMSSGGQGKGGNLPSFALGVLGEHASGFQKYMARPGFNATAGESATSGNFQQYMKGYAGQQGGQQSQSGGYQQYMDKYAADYVNFMGQAGAANATAPSTKASSMQAGGYQQYYQKYMHQGGAQQSQSGDYQQYMRQAGAANATAPSTGGYQQYMDYQKYMHQGGAQQSQSGGYQQYMDKYAADYVNFMGQAGAANATAPTTEASSMQAGGYQQYYQKYMHQGGAQQPNLTNASDPKEWAAYYAKRYAGEYQKYMKENSSNYSVSFAGGNMTQDEALQQWGKTYMDKYAAPYEHYRHREAAASSMPASASSCHNASELKAWRAAKIEQIRSYVPLAYRASAEESVERTFQSNRARIEREQAVQAQRLADEEAGKANQSGSAVPADNKAGKVAPEGPAKSADDETVKSAHDGSAAHADTKIGKAGKQGSAAPADKEAGKVAREALAEPAADKAGKAVQHDASMGSTAAAGSAKTTNQGAADQATAGPPPVATNSSAVQLAGEGSVELVRKARMDGSAAGIAAFAVLVALFVAYVGKGRRRQRVMEPEVYTNLIAEP